ncbi:metal ABC transporter substrate-binding protein [Candidatus Doolittlea endobia]|uniref:Putative periplasmic iron-binding protein n=1 Tax=Candidatus Doolittlea endobia TaxID=1778262 RepID=A0A143WSJ2_9ENTR|nr:metal ABC transporter substrate-binding protein [Candidatus Doolittlea endobia]CUX96796.1 putative periplasmic iron-binding protein precursor [Candidatus Doolittlea endobia]
MKRFTLLCAIALIMASHSALAKTVSVVASFSVLADIVRHVGGEHVKVTELVGDNGDPHVFEPSPKDSQSIAKSDVVFISGLGLEGWIDRLIIASGSQSKIVTVSTGVSPRKIEVNGKTLTDPHAWNSAHNGALYARNIMQALIAIDPQDVDYFREHGETYIQKLEKLDAWAKAKFISIPQAKRKVLTSHDAFGYFGAEYGVQFLSPVGLSTEAEASANDVARLIDQIKKEHITTYFIENQTNPRLVKQIAKASGAQLGGELYPETLSSANGLTGTYEAAFRHNVTTLASSMK